MSAQQLRQEVRTNLKLNLSLSQSIKTLQLSSQELETYINQEILDNPFLIKEDPEDINTETNLYFQKKSTKTYEYPNNDILDTIEAEISLKEHIIKQVNCMGLNYAEKIIAYYLTDFLDDNGYLQIDIDNAAQTLKAPCKKLNELIEKLQTLDPAGVFSRNLKECIKLQLCEVGKYSFKYSKLLDNIELIANKDLGKLAKITNLTIEEVKDLIKNILKLDPKPGRNFSTKNVSVKIPDVTVKINHEGKIIVSSNKDITSAIYANKNYYDDLKNKNLSTQDKFFIFEKFKNANNIVKSVHARIKTISIVAAAIAQEQEDFFKRGILYLKPLTLSKISELTGYDESTISRATSNKYIGTPYGVLDMKYFFSSGLKSKYSKEEVSSHKVKELIKTLISEEDSNSPLSDDEISAMLKQFNVIVARRTISKYRESMNIEPSSKRKRNYCLAY